MIPHWKQKFALLWTGQALSILSSMISQYALIWYLTDLTGSPAVLSLATMAALVPQGILSLFTGTFADRFDRRWIMIISDGAIGLVSLMLAAAAFAAPLPVAPILAVAALRSVGGSLSCPLHPGHHAPVGPSRCPDPVRRLEARHPDRLHAPLPRAGRCSLCPHPPGLDPPAGHPGGRLCHRRSTIGPAARPAGRSTGPAAPALAGHPRGARCAAFSPLAVGAVPHLCPVLNGLPAGIRPISPNEHGVFRRGLRRCRSGGNPVFCRNAGRIGAPGPVGRYPEQNHHHDGGSAGTGAHPGAGRLAAPLRLPGVCWPVPADGPVRSLFQLGVHGPDPNQGGAEVPGPCAGPHRGHHDTGLPPGAGTHRPVRRCHRRSPLVPAGPGQSL